ncbi:MAG: hypothetical protein ACT4QF_01160 [Sporichthyaceae bacterium]
MKISKSRAAFAAAMLVGVSVLAGCGGKDEVESNDAPPPAAPVVTPTVSPEPATPAPSASPSGSPSAAAADVEFLAAADWPAGSRYGTWKPQGEQEGLPDPEYFCITGELPADDTEYQTYSSDREAEARQFVVETESQDEAKALVAKLGTALDGCVERYRKAFPIDEASGEQYADLDLGDGVKRAGFFFAPKDSEYTMQLMAVGRVGATVTVVVLGQGGKADEAPKDAFEATVAKAMEKIGA